MKHNNEDYSVIKMNDDYIVQSILLTKDEGQSIVFPPLSIDEEEVLAYCDSEAEANLWIANKKIELLTSALTEEREEHSITRNRAKALMAVVEAFKSSL